MELHKLNDLVPQLGKLANKELLKVQKSLENILQHTYGHHRIDKENQLSDNRIFKYSKSINTNRTVCPVLGTP